MSGRDGEKALFITHGTSRREVLVCTSGQVVVVRGNRSQPDELGQDLMHLDGLSSSSEEDLFGTSWNEATTAKGAQPKDDANAHSEVLYKFKCPSVGFARVDRFLLSLHVKEGHAQKNRCVSYIEVTDLTTWQCIHPCLLKVDVKKSAFEDGDGRTLWMVALRTGNQLEPNSLALFLHLRGETSLWILPKDLSQANGLDSVPLPEHVAVAGSYDIYRLFYQAQNDVKRDRSKLSSRSLLDKLRRKQQLDLSSDENDMEFVGTAIKDVFPLNNSALEGNQEGGLLILTRDGRLWQFLLEANPSTSSLIKKSIIPIKNCVLASIESSSSGLAYTSNGLIYRFQLPWKPPVGSVPYGQGSEAALTRDDMLHEIRSNVSAIQKIQKENAEKEEFLSQVRLLKLFKEGLNKDFTVKLSTYRESSLFSGMEEENSRQWQLILKLTNISSYKLLGRFWSLDVSIPYSDPEAQLSGSMRYTKNIALPPTINTGKSFVGCFELPKEMLSEGVKVLPIQVTADLVFRASYKDEEVFVRHPAIQTEVTAMNLVRFTGANTGSESIAELPEKETLKEFVQKLGHAHIFKAEPVQYQLQVSLSPNVIKAFQESCHLGAFKDMLPGSAIRGYLLGQPVAFNIKARAKDLASEETFLMEISSRCAATVLALALSLENYKLSFLQERALTNPDTYVTFEKSLLTKIVELHSNLINNVAGWSEAGEYNRENRALLEHYYNKFRCELTRKLP